MARYQRIRSDIAELWHDNEQNVSFVKGDSLEYAQFKAWLDAGNKPDTTPIVAVQVSGPTRQDQIKALAAKAKADVAAAPLNTNGEKALAAIFNTVLDAMAKLD